MLTLELYNARKSKDENADMMQQREHTKTLLIDWVVWTYGSIDRIGFDAPLSKDDQVVFHELVDNNLFYYDGFWFADFSIQNEPVEDHFERFDIEKTLCNLHHKKETN